MYKEILTEEFNQLRQDIVDAYYKKGMFASGEFERQAEVIVDDFSAKIIGVRYTEQLEYGRNPSSRFPPRDAIEKWINDKGVFASAIEEIGISSLAFLIQRKIATLGYDRKDHGGVDLINEIVTPERIQSIIDKCTGAALTEFVSSLNLKKFFEV